MEWKLIWICTHKNPSLDIGKSQLNSMQEGLLLTVHPVVLANILLQSPSSQLLLFLSEPPGGPWEVGQNED